MDIGYIAVLEWKYLKTAGFPSRCVYVYILLDRRYTTMWCNVYIMQLTTGLSC